MDIVYQMIYIFSVDYQCLHVHPLFELSIVLITH